MISINGLHKTFGRNEVLKGIELDIDGGGLFAVLGPNGSGKTTLIKCILGMVLPDRGSIEVLGNNIRNDWHYRENIDYLPQIANFPSNLKVRELLAMIKDLRRQPIDEMPLITYFGLEPFLDKKLATLSGGTKQKVNIVLTFMFDCPLIVLDEPTSGLDPASLIRLKELIQREKKAGKTILVTSHIMQFVAEIADQVIYLLEGRIYFKGPIAELMDLTGASDLEQAIATILTRSGHD